MDAVLRAAITYLVLLLIISESIQGVLIGRDDSFTHALLVIVTLMGLDYVLGVMKQSSPKLARLIEGLPLLLVHHGQPLRDRMDRVQIDAEDILQAARQHGLERLDQIRYAVLERSGKISIIPQTKS